MTNDMRKTQEREAFEKWCAEMSDGRHNLTRSVLGYKAPTPDAMWEGWQARAALSAPAVEGWKPIESAPKNGADILLFCPQGDGSPGSMFRVTEGHWESDPGGTTEYRDAEGRWVGQDDRDGFEGWITWDGGFSEDTMMPTHWMSLPAPPAAAPQPPASHSVQGQNEPVACWINRDVLSALGKDKTARGSVLSGKLKKFRLQEEFTPLYLGPSDAYARGAEDMREKAAWIATSFLVGDPANGVPLRSPGSHEIAKAIRALPLTEGEKPHD